MASKDSQAIPHGGRGPKRTKEPGEEDSHRPSKRARAQGQSGEQFKKNGLRPYARGRPTFWDGSLTHLSEEFFPTVIAPSGHGLTNLVLLTRIPLQELPPFNLFFSGMSNLVILHSGLPFSIKKRRMRDLRRYTLRLHRIIGNKPFICSEQSIPYFLAPMSAEWTSPHAGSAEPFPEVSSHIDWDAVMLAASQAYVRVESGSSEVIAEQLQDAVIQDRWVEYTKRYFVVKIRHDLSPMHKPAEGEVRHYNKSRIKFLNISPARGRVRHISRLLQGPSQGFQRS